MKKRTLILGAVVVSLMVATAMAFIFLDRSAKGQQKPIKKYSELPKIISDVETLEIVDANLKDEGTTDAFVKFKIKNNSDKSIIAISIESGDDKNASGKMVSGVPDGDGQPSVIIQPYELYQTEFPLSNVMPGLPTRIIGVIYANGTGDGNESTLESMRRDIEDNKNRMKEDLPQ